MTSKGQILQNTILVRKDSSIQRTADHIDYTLDRLTEIQIRSAGTAVQKAILVAEKCAELGIAQYSRFTTQMVPFEDRQILYAIIKLKRPVNSKKPQTVQKKQQKQPQKTSNQQKRAQNQNNNNRKHSQDQYEPERNRRQAYNNDHRERNERREQQRYEKGNFEKGQKNNQHNYNEQNKREKYQK